jgi:4-hydroxybenzoate decarboxylase
MVSQLKQSLDQLDRRNELIRISKAVDPRFEASALIKRIQQVSNKAILFEKIKGYDLPLVSNILGTYQRVAMILGCEVDEINSTWNRKEKDMELFSPISGRQEPDEYVESAIHEITSLTYCEKDAGPYITAGMALARDPDTGVTNLSFHRLQIVDDSKLRFRITPGNHLETLYQNAEKRNEPLEVAILLGGHPALMFAAASRLPIDQDELKLAGAFLGHPVKLRQCKKINLEVPTGIDFVIEGALLPNVREEEGPFGDFLGYYVPVLKNHVFEVRYVSRLKDSYAYGILAGSAEQDLLVGVPIAANIYKIVKGAIPSVIDVACLPHVYHSVVKMKQEFEGQARQAALAALSCDPSQTKICTVVDPDVDIHNPLDVSWAITTRCCPDTGVFIVPNIPSFRRDPFRTHWGKMGIDATMPLSEEAASDFQRTRIPGVENIKLEDYLP